MAARAIVRGLLLTMMEQPEVRRVPTRWDCDGENLLVSVRDDGNGALSTARHRPCGRRAGLRCSLGTR
ncbi:hypothetical protein SAMN04489738_2020 [Pseudarthrobacter chlorophenolicus]|nr:hypothetical protein SAMN04489738_2020 [Pseudarthrobacter chlorophenolicus]